mmetsp:Transcript_14430/g.17510  ORF Transcript_14430/g.17510 Transcript_14430/m.17510 type:complete len:94 (-) Transcript_14430:347-628(-)
MIAFVHGNTSKVSTLGQNELSKTKNIFSKLPKPRQDMLFCTLGFNVGENSMAFRFSTPKGTVTTTVFEVKTFPEEHIVLTVFVEASTEIDFTT